MAKPIEAQRSGFLNQLLYGKLSFAARPPRLFEDFGLSVLARSDTSIESHRVLTALKDEQTEDGKLVSGTASRIFKIQQDPGAINEKKEVVKTTYTSGVGPFSAYYAYSASKTPDENTNFYETFSTLRKIIFGFFKIIDDIVRIPAIVFATAQLLFERIGWKLQALHKKTDNRLLKATAFVFVGIPGFTLNAIGAIAFRAAVFVSKILAEAVRTPLAIIGATIGLIFGGIVSIFQRILNQGTAAHSVVKPGVNSIFQGMLDGIRPFAPEFANNLQIARLQTEMQGATIRWPFQHRSQDVTRKHAMINPPWTSIAMFAVSFIAVIVFSTVHISLGKPALHHLLNPTGLDAVLAKTIFATLALMSISGLQAALVGIIRGVKAFFNDLISAVSENKTETLKPDAVAQNQIQQQLHAQEQAKAQQSPPAVRFVRAADINNNNNNKTQSIKL